MTITLTDKAKQALGWVRCPLCQHQHGPEMRQHLVAEVEALARMLRGGRGVDFIDVRKHLENVVLPQLRNDKPPSTPTVPKLSPTMLRMVDGMLDIQTGAGEYAAGESWFVPRTPGRHAAMRSLVRQGLAEVKQTVCADRHEDDDREVPGYGLTADGLRVAQLLRERAQGLFSGRPTP